MKRPTNTHTGTDKGQIQWPEEAAFLVGGKMAEDVGFLVEAGLAGTVALFQLFAAF
jgi:hypothetical protein